MPPGFETAHAAFGAHAAAALALSNDPIVLTADHRAELRTAPR